MGKKKRHQQRFHGVVDPNASYNTQPTKPALPKYQPRKVEIKGKPVALDNNGAAYGVNFKKLRGSATIAINDILGNERYKYVDNGSNILAVCHLDTVQPLSGNLNLHVENGKTRLYNPVWDDRLGLYTIVYHLPNICGIKMDWLFTTDEEKGKSTAADFMDDYLDEKARGLNPKKWNWIVEFDRTGTDVAVYDYWSKDFKAQLTPFFPDVDLGTFTDITGMEDLGVKGFNVGVGYYQYHAADAYFVVEEYLQQIDRFVQFYNQYKDTELTHVRDYSSFRDTWSWDYKTQGMPKTRYDSSTYVYDDAAHGYTRMYSSNHDLENCSVCGGYGARHVTTLLNGTEVFMCLDCVEMSVERFYKDK